MKKTRLPIIVFFICFLCFSPNVFARDKRAAINELLDIAGISALGEAMVDNAAEEMINSIKDKKKNLPKRVFEIIIEEKELFINDELVKNKTLYNFLYYECDAKFSNDEIEELLEFYRTPIGKKAASMYSVINAESINISYKWYAHNIQKFPKRVLNRLEKEGINPKDYI